VIPTLHSPGFQREDLGDFAISLFVRGKQEFSVDKSEKRKIRLFDKKILSSCKNIYLAVEKYISCSKRKMFQL